MDPNDRNVVASDDATGDRERDVLTGGTSTQGSALAHREEDGGSDPFSPFRTSDKIPPPPTEKRHKNRSHHLPTQKAKRSPEELRAYREHIQKVLDAARSKKDKRPPEDSTVLVKIGKKWETKAHTDTNVGTKQFRATEGVIEKMEAEKVVDEVLTDAVIESPIDALEKVAELAESSSGQAIDEIDAYIKKLLKPRIKRLIFKAVELAEGIFIEKKMPGGKKIYTTPPNERMLNYLLDQYFGRAKSRKDGMGNERNEVKITLRKLG
jgi:hypothetical protein